MNAETKSKATPGPWEVDELNCPIDGEEFITIQYQGMPICEVRGTNDMSCLEDDEMEEANEMVIANAYLIAAAPELLEALESVIRLKALIDYKPPIREKHIGEAMALSGMLSKVEAAIKKAKG